MERLGCSYNTLMKLERDKLIRPIRRGKWIRYAEEEIERFIRDSMGSDYNVVRRKHEAAPVKDAEG